ncbi:DUF424 family protein [Candidatus Woesearchaeota archaeon]|nr:DUF424 family protein [Candidatus Woesearchaeota archaeon]
MYIKIHKAPAGEVIAVCDENILGKTLEDKKKHIKVSEHFYKGEIKDAAAIAPILETATNINLIGKEAVALGLKLGIIAEENVMVIAGVPHAQVYAP